MTPARDRVVRSRKKEVFMRPDNLHKVYYRASQVERSLPCHPIEVKVGVRLAMLYPTGEFHSAIPEEKFYIGTVTEITTGGMMRVEFDGNPYCEAITCGIDQYRRLCIPAPTLARSQRRRGRGK